MKNKTIVIKCRRFDHNWVIDRATSMWLDVETINRQIAVTPEQIRSVRYDRIFHIGLASGCREGYDEYVLDNFLDKVTSHDKRDYSGLRGCLHEK